MSRSNSSLTIILLCALTGACAPAQQAPGEATTAQSEESQVSERGFPQPLQKLPTGPPSILQQPPPQTAPPMIKPTLQLPILPALRTARVAAGEDHTCRMKADGTVFCIGKMTGTVIVLKDLQLQLLERVKAQPSAGTPAAPEPPSEQPIAISDATAIAAGGQFTCALKSTGGVACWGEGGLGQLGNNSSKPSMIPIDVPGLTHVTAISAGETHACALLVTGMVQCWGSRADYRRLAFYNGIPPSVPFQPSYQPVAVQGLTNAVAIASGAAHDCALLHDGSVHCWGYNEFGELHGLPGAYTPTPVPVPDLRAQAITARANHTCALLQDGTVRCWGDNSAGQNGVGSAGLIYRVSEVFGLKGATAISAGDYHACAVLNDRTVACWGQNRYGQLGDGATLDVYYPVQVRNLANVSTISAGGLHTCAVLRDGLVKCWGNNSQGQLLDGTQKNSLVPVP